jgi:hypothetical protein
MFAQREVQKWVERHTDSTRRRRAGISLEIKRLLTKKKMKTTLAFYNGRTAKGAVPVKEKKQQGRLKMLFVTTKGEILRQQNPLLILLVAGILGRAERESRLCK